MVPRRDAIDVLRFVPDHADAYVEVRQRMLRKDPWAFGSSPTDDLEGDRNRIRELLASDDRAIVGAIEPDCGVILATAGLIRYKGPKRSHMVSIWGVWTEPAYRGRGLGRRVMLGAIDVARGWSGVECVTLSVSERRIAAKCLYESLGFETWGVQPDTMRVGEESAAEHYMQVSIEDVVRS